MKVNFKDLVDALEFHVDESTSFIHLKTGEIYLISDEEINHAENDSCDYPDWQKDNIEIAKDYLKNESDYLAIPSQYDVDEYRMMEDFASQIEDQTKSEQLFICLRGKGAFRRFKDQLIRSEIENDWYQFKREKYEEFAKEWCEANVLEFS